MAPERGEGGGRHERAVPPRGPVGPITLLRQLFADGFFYMVYFQEPGVADAELGGDPARTMRRLLAGPKPNEMQPADVATLLTKGDAGFIDRLPEPPGPLPGWLSQEDLDFYVAEFTRTGFTGGLNWYRNLDRNWELTAHLADAHITCPTLFITGSNDPVIGFAPVEPGLAFLDDHRGNVSIEGAGHWVQQERPAEVNAALVGFLNEI